MPLSSSSRAMAANVSRIEYCPIRMGAEFATMAEVEAVTHNSPLGAARIVAGEEMSIPRGSSKPTRATPRATAMDVACGAHEATTGCEDTRVVCCELPIFDVDIAASFSETSDILTELVRNESAMSSVCRRGVALLKLR